MSASHRVGEPSTKLGVDIRKRLAITALLTIGLSMAGIWLGEDISESVPVGLIPLLIGAGLSAFLVAPWRSAVGRSCTAAAMALVVLGGWYLGRTIANAAFSDCVDGGESVRTSLADYKRKNGTYPKNLGQLTNGNLPGERLLRKTLLRYRRTKHGYDLTFSDWLVTFRATETEPFAASK